MKSNRRSCARQKDAKAKKGARGQGAAVTGLALGIWGVCCFFGGAIATVMINLARSA